MQKIRWHIIQVRLKILDTWEYMKHFLFQCNIFFEMIVAEIIVQKKDTLH